MEKHTLMSAYESLQCANEIHDKVHKLLLAAVQAVVALQDRQAGLGSRGRHHPFAKRLDIAPLRIALILQSKHKQRGHAAQATNHLLIVGRWWRGRGGGSFHKAAT